MQGDGKKELKDWLHSTGKDIAKMVGDHLKKTAKDKAVLYAQEQLGLGLMDSLTAGLAVYNTANNFKKMKGSGSASLNQWLRDTGKDIGDMVGDHLKKVAKDKALLFAQEQLGLGIADELGMAGQGRMTLGEAGTAIGKHLKDRIKAVQGQGLADDLQTAATSVASKSTAHALDKAGDVTDVASAKAAAKSVGEVAKNEGLAQLTNLAGTYLVLHTGLVSYFGGCMAQASYFDTARRLASFLAKKPRFVTTSNG